MKKLSVFLQSKTFKQIYFVVFLFTLLIGIYIVVDPKPFLKFGYFGIFIFNSIGGLGTYLVPTLSQKLNLVLLSFSTALGMAINDSISWVVGSGGSAIIQRGRWVNRIEKIVNKYGSLSLFIISALPVPYDAIGLISGYLGIKYKNFFLPTFLGKFIRMILIGLGTAQLIKLF